MEDINLLAAKTDPEDQEKWLPLPIHLKDCAGIIEKLIAYWVPDSVITASGLEREDFEKTAVFLAYLHDIGKATSWFQCVITENMPDLREKQNAFGLTVKEHFVDYADKGKTPHAWAGQWILAGCFEEMTEREDLTSIIGSHHGRPSNDLTDSVWINSAEQIKLYYKNFFGESNSENQWRSCWKTLYIQALQRSNIEQIDEIPKLSEQAQVLLCGLLIVADWISSNTRYFPLIPQNLFEFNEAEEDRVDRGWERLNFPEMWEPDINAMDMTVFMDKFGFVPNDVQHAVLDAVNHAKHPGLYIIEAQMGVGKTEAALAAADVLAERFGQDGIFFGMPTQATANGIFPRVLSWAEEESEETVNAVRLAHGAASFNDDYNQLLFSGQAEIDEEDSEGRMEVHSWFEGNKKALLADFVIGTVDQFLMSSLKRKHFMLRHLGLAGKVVIIDEVHAYDAYMNQYLDRAISWMAAYGVPVILLSATLPEKRRNALVNAYVKTQNKFSGEKHKKVKLNHTLDYPLLTWSDGGNIYQKKIDQNIETKRVTIERLDEKLLIDAVERDLSDGGCGVVIVNTVAKAQKLYTLCCNDSRMQNYHLLLYHAQFTSIDRAQKENAIIRALGKKSGKERDYTLVIGTQVLEQSLDYDADVMYSELCPMDLLLQRMGRLHRHKGRKRPKQVMSPRMVILEDSDSEETIGQWDKATDLIYSPYLLKRTDELLQDEVTLPNDISRLVQRVYDENSMGMTNESELKKNYERVIQDKEQRGKNWLLKKPGKGSLFGMLINDDPSSEKLADARVRDGISAIEILVMVQQSENHIVFLPGHSEGIQLNADYPPSNDEGRLIARERLRLPHVFCTEWMIQKTIEDLEEQNRRWLSEWQECPWIKGELVLLLNEHLEGRLNGFKLRYSTERGLEYQKEEKDDGQ